jgi:hypothetical protein
MYDFSERWQITAAIILVVAALLYGIFCTPVNFNQGGDDESGLGGQY